MLNTMQLLYKISYISKPLSIDNILFAKYFNSPPAKYLYACLHADYANPEFLLDLHKKREQK